MILTVTIGLLVLFLIALVIARPYQTGKKPVTFRKIVDIPADKVAEVYDRINIPLFTFISIKQTIEPDGTLVTFIHDRYSDNPDKLVSIEKSEKIGGTELCPIYRVFDVDGKPYPYGEDHYSVSAFGPMDDKTILIYEERIANISFFQLLLLCFVMKRALAAKTKSLKNLQNGEAVPKPNDEAPARNTPKPVASSAAFGEAAPSISRSVKAEPSSHYSPSWSSSASAQVNETPKAKWAKWAPGSAGFSVRRRGKLKDSKFFERHSSDIIVSLLAVASFMVMFGWEGGLLLAPLILLHEYGHLLAFQLTGQKGSKLMLIPFFGGLAIANEAHKTEFHRAFCALMGPAICAPVSIILAVAAVAVGDHWTWWWLAYAAMLCGMGNALNMAPIMPFDGGQIMQSIAKSLSRGQARAAMMVISAGGAVMMMQGGYGSFAYITYVWLATSLIQTERTDTEPTALDLKGGLNIAGMYLVVLACHVGTAMFIYDRFY